ncbi:hypothetical protein DMENIID0001_098070 [Sergentomyia squamirostris]
MSNSAKVHGLELPQNYKHTNSDYQNIKNKFVGGSIYAHTKTESPARLEDAEAEVLEKRRQELQKQLKMESSKKKEQLLKKHKKVLRPSSTSDSSSSSDSGSSKNSSSDDSSSSSSSSSRSSSRKKTLKRSMKRRRASSSSSDDRPPSKKKLTARKHSSHKKSLVKSHTKKASSSKVRTSSFESKKRSLTPAGMKSSQKILGKQKILVKEKHHVLLKERSREEKDREMHREKEKLRIHVKEARVRSKTPVKARVKSRSPRRSPPRSRDSKRRSHEKRLSPTKIRAGIRRERSADRMSKGSLKDLSRRNDASSSVLIKERDRRDKERADREAARNKERAEALARCQERQRERERLAKEKDLAEREKGERGKLGERLLPRPAERAMALAASRGESHDKMDRERPRSRSNVRGDFPERPSYEGRPAERRYHDSPTIRRERDERHPERSREHEYMIVRNRSDTRNPLAYDGTRRPREEHEMYTEVPIEPRYEPQENRHMTQEYSTPRPQYTTDRMHRNPHEWDPSRERVYERQPPEHIPPNRGGMQNEWERNDMNLSGTMGRNQEPYNENAEWKDRQWEEPTAPVVTKPPQSNWQGGMKEDNWEGYQERKPWHQEMPPDTGRRWQPRRSGGHPGMNNPGEAGENRPEPPYRRPGIQHMHGHPPPHVQGGDHMPQMGGNPMGGPPGMYHHNPGIRHMPPSHPGPQDMGGMQMGGPHPPGPQHFMPNQNMMPQMLPKRMRVMDETHHVLPDQQPAPPHEIPVRSNLIKVNTTSDEVIEDNLSEISDDADDILNSVENTTEQKGRSVGEEKPEEKKTVDGVKTPQDATDDKEDLTEKVKDLNDDFNLGFEEISDGELEEEARVKGLGDALGVDWASLVTESRAKDQANAVQTTSVRQKWKYHQVLLDVGISTKLAGEEFTKELLKRAREAAEEDTPREKSPEECNNVVQVAERKATEKRARLISQASGCHSRALNARRDLQIRRQLCGFPVQEVHYCSVNPELTNLALQHFKNKVTAVTT